MKKSRFTDPQIMSVLKQAEGGMAVPELCREHGISAATFYKWRAKFASQVQSEPPEQKQIAVLEDENRRLKQLLGEAMSQARAGSHQDARRHRQEGHAWLSDWQIVARPIEP